MAEGGWGSGTWGEAGWGMSVYARDASETAAASESEVVAGSTFLAAVVETGQVVELPSPLHTFYSGVEEAGAGGDTMLVAPSTLGVSVSEASTAAEGSSVQQVFATTISEAALGAEDMATQQAFASAVDEAATGSEQLGSNFAYYGSVDETATASDDVSTQHIMPVSVSEDAGIADAVSASHTLETSVSEGAVASVEAVVAASIFYAYVVAGATAADAITSRYLWELIDDNEDANWQNINDGQTPGWATVGDTQTPNWADIAT